MESIEDIEQIALEMNREQKKCPTCLGTKLKGRGRSKDGNASDAMAPSPPCDHCLGRGYLWFTKLLDPSMPRANNSGITTERMLEMWEKRIKRRAPATVERKDRVVAEE